MKAYVVVQQSRFLDRARFEAYREEVLATVEAHGGRFLVRGGAVTVKEGGWPFERLVMLEFPSRAAAETWYGSPEYQKILPLRLDSVEGSFLVVDGIE